MSKIKGFISYCIAQGVKVIQLLAFVILGPKLVGLGVRLNVALRIVKTRRNNRGRTASTFGEQLVLAGAILDLPPERPGTIAEFGCFKGVSTVAISIAASKVGRRVQVFDSFEGLPEPKDQVHQVITGKAVNYHKGEFVGTLEEVRDVVTRYGEMNQVEFVKGYFCNTLPVRPAEEKYALIFEDADLVQSIEDILRYGWPRLAVGGIFFCHEALDLEAAKLFFNDDFWLKHHGQKAPGLAGVGTGLPIDWGKWGNREISTRFGSCLAATIKRIQG